MVVALEEEQICGVGMDALVHDPAPLGKYGKLWSFPNVVTAPHIETTTAQSQSESASAAMKNVWDYFEGPTGSS